jgi:hypothetical protein
MPGLESIISYYREDVSDITLTMSGENLGTVVGPLEEYLPYTRRVEGSVS